MLPNQPTDDFPYRVETQIGSGAMGLVYRAHEPALDRPVAIKVLRLGPLEQRSPSERDELHRRFLQEGRAAARLSHPAVTTVYRVGEVAVPSERLIGRAFDEDVPLSMPYLAMEWLDGHTLATRMQTRSRLPVGEAVHLVLQLLDALRIAHRAGVVHRDLKPANLMILAEGRLKVTDFGIASLEERSLVETQEGIILATPKFAAPEQLRGESVDLRADLHAVGVLLYHMVTGAMPYEGTTFMALANAILAEPPIAPRRYAPGLPDALVDVIERALAKNPSERYADAAAMAQSLLPLAPGAQAELLSLSLSASPVPVGAAAPITVSPTPAADDFDDVAEQTLPMPSVRSVTTVADLPAHPAQRVATVVRDWPASTLPEQSIDALIDRLVDRPLHAPAFTGAVQIGAVHLLVSDGVLCGLCDAERGETGDAVAVRLPETAAPVLRPHPDGADAAPVVRLLAALLMPEPGWTD
ncbi:MAG: serine/threonine-protein kinase, partial [Acidobacteriota bacterium]